MVETRDFPDSRPKAQAPAAPHLADPGEPHPRISGNAAKGHQEPDPPKPPREKGDAAQIWLAIRNQPEKRLQSTVE